MSVRLIVMQAKSLLKRYIQFAALDGVDFDFDFRVEKILALIGDIAAVMTDACTGRQPA